VYERVKVIKEDDKYEWEGVVVIVGGETYMMVPTERDRKKWENKNDMR
jgi:hypothetical protein